MRLCVSFVAEHEVTCDVQLAPGVASNEPETFGQRRIHCWPIVAAPFAPAADRLPPLLLILPQLLLPCRGRESIRKSSATTIYSCQPELWQIEVGYVYNVAVSEAIASAFSHPPPSSALAASHTQAYRLRQQVAHLAGPASWFVTFVLPHSCALPVAEQLSQRQVRKSHDKNMQHSDTDTHTITQFDCIKWPWRIAGPSALATVMDIFDSGSQNNMAPWRRHLGANERTSELAIQCPAGYCIENRTQIC